MTRLPVFLMICGLAAAQCGPNGANSGSTAPVCTGISISNFGVKCDGITDDRAGIQAALNAAAGISILDFPNGETCLISPVKDKTMFLSLPAGTRTRGRATLKVANGSAPYDAVLYSTDCTQCEITDLNIDSNVAGNPLVNGAAINAHPRIEIIIQAGSDVTVNKIFVTNSSSMNSVVVYGARVSVTDCSFSMMGDDPDHVIHDTSSVYVHGSQLTIARNQFTAARRGAPGGYTAIEFHGTSVSVTDNRVTDYTNGINITGIYDTESQGLVVTGNLISGCLYGMEVWSSKLSKHTTGYGINGLTIANNNIRVNQLSYTVPIWGNFLATGGVIIDPNANLPLRNVSIINNVVTFDLEAELRAADSSSIGIGVYSVGNIDLSDITVGGNVIDNAPISGIRFSVGSLTGGNLLGNSIRNAGSSLDATVSWGYKMPVMLAAFTGALQVQVEGNFILDDQGTSRMAYALSVSGTDAANNVQFLWNTVSLSGTNTESWLGYFYQSEDYSKPLVRMVAAAKPWVLPTNSMRGGSQVFDVIDNAEYVLRADGIDWRGCVNGFCGGRRRGLPR